MHAGQRSIAADVTGGPRSRERARGEPERTVNQMSGRSLTGQPGSGIVPKLDPLPQQIAGLADRTGGSGRTQDSSAQ
jgi:hypothetical protein